MARMFSSDRGGLPSLWRVPASGGPPRRLVGIGEYAMSPSVSLRGGRLAYVYWKKDANIWRAPGPESPMKGDAPVKLIASTQNEDSPQFSPDGKRIAFSSDRSGSWEIWASASDGQNPIRLTNFGGSHAGTPRWSPDGKQIAFGIVEIEIYEPVAGGEIRRRD
jgi:Tol biopolymer transport system component